MARDTDDADFFLPDLCQAQSILFLVLIAELLVLVQVLFTSNLFNFNWMELGLKSLFIQWLVLTSAALLCNIRPILKRMSLPVATIVSFTLIILMTLIFSVVAEFILNGFGILATDSVGRILRNIVIAIIMTGIAFRYFFLAHELRMREQAELTSRIQALQSRIRPHFLFNSMNIIASLISVDPETAEEVVEDLSVLFRASLNEATGSPVKLSEEISLCEKYVHIEGLRLDDRLEVDWRIDADTDAIRIPLLTLQPLLENAIYHGIQPRPDGGLVTVSVQEHDDSIDIVITNPLGPEGYQHEEGNQMALENIRHRLTAVYGPNARLETLKDNDKETYTTTVSYPLV